MRKLSLVLNKKIEFISKINTKDQDGYPIEKEISIRKCYANIRSLRGKEFYNAAMVHSEDDKVFRCRFFKGLEPKMFIKYNEKLYNIKSINDLNENHKEYEIYASEVSPSE